ncbi:DUF4397 domain-containing protein [Chitinophaga horti]|uniref:DUF4397 domain-containing protein n=1 Tax=Chitinophaga horti TaxID=2920382 RepID=A0ABY6J402_9BACT|nr:DUF4397 domain-containing protein [Chitinophaga horti]UYQ94240.1 DUF4397 domain-containing protein [Chitinophaga horti]
MLTRMNRLWTLVAAAAILITGFSSCLKSGDPQPAQPYSILSLINLAVYPASQDVFNNGKKITSRAFEFGQYATLQVTPGTQEFSFKKYNSDSSLTTNQALYDTLAWHSVITYNNNVAGADSSVKVVNIIEDYSNVTSDKAYMRFLHVGQDVGNVRVVVNDVEIFGERAYGDFVGSTYQKFWGTNAGVVKIEVFELGSTTALASKTFTDFAAGNVYTVYLAGLKKAAGTDARKIALNVYKHSLY